MKNQQPKMLVLTVAIFGALIVSIVGIGYAWFSATVNNTNPNSIVVNAANLGTITYYTGTKIQINGIYPGWCETKKVKIVSNGSTVARPYVIGMQVVTNELRTVGSSQNYMQVSGTVVAGETSTASGGRTNTKAATNITIASGNMDIITNAAIAGNDTHTYNIQFCFPEKKANQNSQQGKNFKAYLKVTTYNTQANSTR